MGSQASHGDLPGTTHALISGAFFFRGGPLPAKQIRTLRRFNRKTRMRAAPDAKNKVRAFATPW